jgi:YidC/Oxa1 family membrane protein insertase
MEQVRTGFFAEWANVKRFGRLSAAQRSLVFYAESVGDWPHLGPLIEHLTQARNKSVTYLTSDPRDPRLAQIAENFRPFYVGSGLARTLLFRMMDARILVMTLPDLDRFQLKRSSHPVHYVYVFHSLVSSHMIYRPRAFEAYDTILCAGPHHVREIRREEELRGLKPKHLVPHGYGRLDTLEAAARSKPHAPRASADPERLPFVLIAPSWGPRAITETCGLPLVDRLLAAGNRVVYRPHPMTVRQSAACLAELVSRHGKNPAFSLETDVSGAASLHAADLMISDWSGAALEFALGLKRPVLFIDVPRKVNHPGYAELGLEPVEVSLRAELGAVLGLDRLETVAQVAARLIAETPDFAGRMEGLKDRVVFNAGSSAGHGAQAILELQMLSESKSSKKKES